MVSGWRVEARAADLSILGPVDVFTDLEFTLRHRQSGGWMMTLPGDHPQASLFTPGSGVKVWAPWSTEPVLTGPVTGLSTELGDGSNAAVLVVSGVDDTALLGDRLVLPDPASDPDDQGVDGSYTVTGAAEVVIRDLVDKNAGDSALTGRRVCDAGTSGSPALGSSRTVSARFDNLLTLCAEVAATDNLGFRVLQPSDVEDLELVVYAPVDRSASVRLSQPAGTLTAASTEVAAPAATHVLVGGGGEDTLRVLVERSDAALVSEWSRRIEVFRDARDTDDTTELAQRGDETLAEAAATAGLSLQPTDTPTQRFGYDYGLGDTVAVDINGTSYTDVVMAVTVRLSAADGALITPMVGDPELADINVPAIYRRVRDIQTRLDNIERRL